MFVCASVFFVNLCFQKFLCKIYNKINIFKNIIFLFNISVDIYCLPVEKG